MVPSVAPHTWHTCPHHFLFPHILKPSTHGTQNTEQEGNYEVAEEIVQKVKENYGQDSFR